MRWFLIGSSISTPSPTSCIRSLSEEMIVTRPPSARAWQARVAMMSSASKSAISMQATLKARVASRVSGNCGFSSSGGSGRLAL